MDTIQIPANELTEFDLPRVCVITGATDGVSFRDVKYQWYPRWVAALILINVLIAAVVAFALTKRVKGKLPFTDAGYEAMKKGSMIFGLSFLAAFLLMAGSIVAFANDVPAAGFVALVAMFALPIAAWFMFARGTRITCTRIEDGVVTLRFPSASAMQAFDQHLRGGRSVAASSAT